MQKLTLLTVGALAIGLGGFVHTASAQSLYAQVPASCSAREVSIYFDKDTTAFNKFSQQLVERVAADAKACGAPQVVAEVKSGPERAQAVSHAFNDLGVGVILTGNPKRVPSAETLADREVVIRVGGNQPRYVNS
jgi:hypothetical protein